MNKRKAIILSLFAVPLVAVAQSERELTSAVFAFNDGTAAQTICVKDIGRITFQDETAMQISLQDGTTQTVSPKSLSKITFQRDEATGIQSLNVSKTNGISRTGDIITLPQTGNVEVLGLNGQLIMRRSNVGSINISSLKKGIYIIKSQKQIFKFLK